jgi:hypothetical protein
MTDSEVLQIVTANECRSRALPAPATKYKKPASTEARGLFAVQI